MNITDILQPLLNAETMLGTAIQRFASACDSKQHLQAAVELGKIVASARAIASLELPMTAVLFSEDNYSINQRLKEAIDAAKAKL